MRKFSGLLIGAMALAIVVGFSAKADAAFIAYICNDAACSGTGDTIVTDQGAGDNFPGSAIVGQISAGAINVGGLTIVTNTAQSKPLIGGVTNPSMDLAYTATGIGEVWLYASDTDFTGAQSGSLLLNGNFSCNGLVPCSTDASAYWSATNANRALTTQIGSTIGPFSGIGSQETDGSTSGPFGQANPYSITLAVHIVRGSEGTSTGDLLLTSVPVPEPASMALFGLGMLGFGIASRRRRTV